MTDEHWTLEGLRRTAQRFKTEHLPALTEPPKQEYRNTLKALDPAAVVEEAMGILGATISMSLPSDDQHIMENVRSAHRLLLLVYRAQGGNR